MAGNSHPFASAMQMGSGTGDQDADRNVGFVTTATMQTGFGTQPNATPLTLGTLSAGISAGVTTFTLSAGLSRAINQGDVCVITWNGGASQETCIVKSVAGTTVTLMAATLNAHLINDTVAFYAPNGSNPGAACVANGQRGG